jgi:hypothetical protein
MKKLLLALSLLAIAGSASAQWHHHGGYYRGGYSNNWIAPALIGGVIGYELNRPRYYEPAVIVQQPVIVQQQPPVIIQQPQPYAQTPPLGYHWEEMIDPQTGVRKIVAVPN